MTAQSSMPPKDNAAATMAIGAASDASSTLIALTS